MLKLFLIGFTGGLLSGILGIGGGIVFVPLLTYFTKEDFKINTGIVKWFNGRKGYGFIEPEDGGNDVFVHVTALKDSGIKFLNEGDKVSYELTENRGRMAAGNLSLDGESSSDSDEAPSDEVEEAPEEEAAEEDAAEEDAAEEEAPEEDSEEDS